MIALHTDNSHSITDDLFVVRQPGVIEVDDRSAIHVCHDVAVRVEAADGAGSHRRYSGNSRFSAS